MPYMVSYPLTDIGATKKMLTVLDMHVASQSFYQSQGYEKLPIRNLLK